jgi:hypothetical protein
VKKFLALSALVALVLTARAANAADYVTPIDCKMFYTITLTGAQTITVLTKGAFNPLLDLDWDGDGKCDVGRVLGLGIINGAVADTVWAVRPSGRFFKTAVPPNRDGMVTSFDLPNCSTIQGFPTTGGRDSVFTYQSKNAGTSYLVVYWE